MNKKMRELLGRIDTAHKAAADSFEAGDVSKAKAELDKADELREEYAVAEKLYLTEISRVPDNAKDSFAKKAADGFGVIVKMVKNMRLTDDEKALVLDGNSGENYLVPEDVDTAIRELRREYKSAKDLVTVIPTSSTAGSFVFEKGGVGGLDNFSDGEEIPEGETPTFVSKKFTITFFGKLIPVSNILKGAEKGGLIAYIKEWFVKNAIVTENKKIFATLAADKEVVKVKGWKELKSTINLKLDPSCKIGGVIVTNQTGFDILDSEVDKNGKPILKENPKDETEMRFKGLPIHVFSNDLLPNVSKKAPLFVGNLKSGCYFEEMIGHEFAASEHALFGKNQTAMRIIEGFDVIQADSDAYVYATLEPSETNGETA